MSDISQDLHAELLLELGATGNPIMADAAEFIKYLVLVIRMTEASLANKPFEVILPVMWGIAQGPFGKLSPMVTEQRHQQIKSGVARDQSEIGIRAMEAISSLEAIQADLHQQLNARIDRRLQEMRDNPDTWGQA